MEPNAWFDKPGIQRIGVRTQQLCRRNSSTIAPTTFPVWGMLPKPLIGAAISAQLRIIPFDKGGRGLAGPAFGQDEPQIGCGVACVRAAFKRARLCINDALRA